MHTNAMPRERRRFYRRAARKLAAIPHGQCLRASLRDRASRENREAAAAARITTRTLLWLADLVAARGAAEAAEIVASITHGAAVILPGGDPIRGASADGIAEDDLEDDPAPVIRPVSAYLDPAPRAEPATRRFGGGGMRLPARGQ